MTAMAACACGCDVQLTVRDDHGRQRSFAHGHNRRGIKAHWQDRRSVAGGYVILYEPEHPHARADGYVFEHRRKVERALGKTLRLTAPVHHVNEDKSDNRNTNLVACDSARYHKLLHARARALAACGHAGWLRCWICKTWDEPQNLTCIHRGAAHRHCKKVYEARQHLRRRAAV